VEIYNLNLFIRNQGTTEFYGVTSTYLERYEGLLAHELGDVLYNKQFEKTPYIPRTFSRNGYGIESNGYNGFGRPSEQNQFTRLGDLNYPNENWADLTVGLTFKSFAYGIQSVGSQLGSSRSAFMRYI